MCKYDDNKVPEIFAEQLMKQDEHILSVGIQSENRIKNSY